MDIVEISAHNSGEVCQYPKYAVGAGVVAPSLLILSSAEHWCGFGTARRSPTSGNAQPPFSRSPRERRPRRWPSGVCCGGDGSPRSTPGCSASEKRGRRVSPSGQAGGGGPLFPPQHSGQVAAKEAILHVVRRDPRQFGLERARWRLSDLLSTCDWLGLSSPSSLCHLLRRLGISYKRGRDYVHSPDPHYAEKLAFRDVLLQKGRQTDRREVVLLQDELTYYRQPRLARAYEATGREQPLSQRSHRSNTTTRLVSTLDVLDGRVLYRQGSVIGIEQLVRFYQHVHAAYPQAERIWMIQDNWSIHFHPDLLVALEKQQSRWPRYVPPRWSKEPTARALRNWGDLSLPIQLVPLPTYASWLNPIEKLWRWLKQDWLHLHRFADHLTALRAGVVSFLDRFDCGSQALLRYTGLFPYA